MSVHCLIGQLTIDKELPFAGNVFSLGKNIVLTDKAPSSQRQPRSLVGRAPLWLDVTRTCATVGVQVQILSWLNFFLDLIKWKSTDGLNKTNFTILQDSIILGRQIKAPRMFSF